jgi:hypothetical protein
MWTFDKSEINQPLTPAAAGVPAPTALPDLPGTPTS